MSHRQGREGKRGGGENGIWGGGGCRGGGHTQAQRKSRVKISKINSHAPGCCFGTWRGLGGQGGVLGAALLGVGAPQPLPRPWEGVGAAKAPGGSPCTQRHPWVHGAAGNGGVPTQPPPSPCTRGAARATWDPAQCPPGPGTALGGCGHRYGGPGGGRGAPGTPTASLPKAGSGCGGGQAAGQCGMEAATVRSPPRCRLKKSHPGGRRVEFSPPFRMPPYWGGGSKLRSIPWDRGCSASRGKAQPRGRHRGAGLGKSENHSQGSPAPPSPCSWCPTGIPGCPFLGLGQQGGHGGCSGRSPPRGAPAASHACSTFAPLWGQDGAPPKIHSGCRCPQARSHTASPPPKRDIP